MNSFDLDGVVIIKGKIGVRPGPNDIIITGRSIEEAPDTIKFLNENGIYNQIFFNPLPFREKTRESSGIHKATVLSALMRQFDIFIHFEDDEVQKREIEKYFDSIANNPMTRTMVDRIPTVVLLKHELTEKENVWCGGE